MDKKKMLVMLALVLVVGVLASGVVEAAWYTPITDAFSSVTSVGGGILIFIVNAVLLSLAAILIITLIGGELETKERVYFYIGAAVVGFMIAWSLTQNQPGDYIWQIRQVANFLHVKVIVNTAVVAALFFVIKSILLDKKIESKLAKSAE